VRRSHWYHFSAIFQLRSCDCSSSMKAIRHEDCTTNILSIRWSRFRRAHFYTTCNGANLSDAPHHCDRARVCGRTGRCDRAGTWRADEKVAWTDRHHRKRHRSGWEHRRRPGSSREARWLHDCRIVASALGKGKLFQAPSHGAGPGAPVDCSATSPRSTAIPPCAGACKQDHAL
jgi:hypothetical protein